MILGTFGGGGAEQRARFVTISAVACGCAYKL